MSQSDLLIKVIGVLNYLKIPYMLTGSLVSSIQGEPRSTHDIDIIISIRTQDIPKISQAFPSSDFYLDRESIKEALKNQGIFNLIDMSEGGKVDFWILTDADFDHVRFSRRQSIELFGKNIWISSPEDTILAKLRWSKLCGGSQKHFLDAMKVYEVQYPKLDMDYVKEWIEKLDLTELFTRMTTEAIIV